MSETMENQKHLGFDRSQKLKSFFNDKRTQACSDKESDFEFPESPETTINSEIIQKIVEVPGCIETPEDKSVSWTPISRRRDSPLMK